jgi:pimeloyl-ACP methyl ester carboxylesterase
MEPRAAGSGERRGRGCRTRRSTIGARRRRTSELGTPLPDVAGNSVGGWTALELAKLGHARSVVAIGPAGLWANQDPWQCTVKLWTQHKLGRAFARVTPRVMRSDLGRTLAMGGTVAQPKSMPAEAAIEIASATRRPQPSTPTSPRRVRRAFGTARRSTCP